MTHGGGDAPAKRVALVTPGFPSSERDSTCVPALQLYTAALRAARPELGMSVFALHYPRERGDYPWHGIPVRAMGAANARWPGRATHLLRLARALRDAHRVCPFSILHGFWLSDASLVTARVARREGVPFVLSLMGQDATERNRYLKLGPPATARVVAPSTKAADSFARAGGRSVDAVVPWGVESGPAASRPWRDRDIDILGVGSLTELKDFGVLVRAMAELAQRGLARRAVVIGDGPERGRLALEVARLGLADRVTLRGEVPRAEVLELMDRARVLFHPSRYEGFGLVFAEARAHGMAIVSRRVGAAAEGPAWSIGASEDDLVAAAARLLAEPPRVEAANPFPLDATVEGYLRIYESLVQRA